MKIAFFTDSYYPMLNGVTVSVANYAAELRALGHTVYIFAPKIENYIDKENDVYRLKALKVLDTEPEVHMPFLLPHQYVTDIQPRDFDVIHAHGNGFFSLLGYQYAKIKGVPFVMTFHTQMTSYMHYVFNGKVITPRIAAAGLRLFASICDGVLSPSVKMKNELLSYGVKKKIYITPNFVYSEKFMSAEKNFLHNLCSIPSSSPILLSVGRIGKEKNFPFLIEAFRKVSIKDNKSHLIIVGSGEEKDQIQQLVAELGLKDRVHIIGRVDQKDIPKVYADADIFVFASETETQGVVILEAASAGLPFVVVKDGAYDKAIVDGENGYQVEASIEKFAEKVLTLLNNSELREKFGKRSEELIRDNFSPVVLATDLVAIYEELIDKKKIRKLSLKRLNNVTLRRLYSAVRVFNRMFE